MCGCGCVCVCVSHVCVSVVCVCVCGVSVCVCVCVAVTTFVAVFFMQWILVKNYLWIIVVVGYDDAQLLSW